MIDWSAPNIGIAEILLKLALNTNESIDWSEFSSADAWCKRISTYLSSQIKIRMIRQIDRSGFGGCSCVIYY
jgi:hypothetical protein